MNLFLHKKSPQFQLLVVFMGSAVLMLLYEAVKDWMSADRLTLWQSHAITIVVSAALATVASFHVRRWARALDSELESNIARRHQAEAFGQAMLDAAPVGILAYHTTGRCIMANPIAALLIGASQDDLLAQNFRTLRSWRSSGLLAAAEEALAGNGKEQREVRFTSTFGHDVWAEAVFVPFMLDDQPHVLLMLRDVTEARRATSALAESERAFRSLADNIPDNLIRCDCDGRLLYVNRTLEAVLGRTSAELRGNTAEQNYPDGRFAKLDQAMRQAGATGEAMEFELEYPAIDGAIEIHSIRIVPELDAQRRCGSVLAIGRDVTHKKQLEDELRLAASVFHASSEGVLVTDADATIISINPAFSDITGYAAAEAIGRKPNLLRSDRHDEEFYRQLWETLLATGSWQGEIWNRRKTGEAYLEWLTINRIADETGKTVRFVSVFHDITESRRKDERIRHLAFHDALTGLPNRALFQERLGHAIERARRNDEYLSVTFIDLDGFKNVNDTLGHDVGDLLLQEVAQRIRVRLRRGADTVARLGGDEFVVLMENLKEAEHCASLAGEIIGDISRPYVIRGTTCHVGASMGIAFYPGDGQTSNDLMKHADTAMYSAKLAGKGTYRFFSSEMLQSVTERLAMEDDLRQAIDREELVLHYQPKIRMQDGKVRGVEALIRWQHPSRGLVLPGDFIPLAEETGMIHAIGDWVLEAACGQLQEWQRKGLATPIAVNVSAAQLTKGKLPERVAGLLDRYRIPATWLHIEITESALMTDTEKAVETLEKLRALGLSIAIDDFGTGYSSLSRLRQLPVDVLKIDRSFVANADRNDKDAQVVRMVVALAESLGLDIVAEGVESVEQVALLRSTGCSVCQGHYFAQAQPAWEIEKLLSQADAQ